MQRYRRSLLFFVLAIICFLGGLGTGRELWYIVSYLLGGLLILSFLWARSSLKNTQIGRRTESRRLQVGQPFEENFWIRNISPLPKLWIEIQDHSTLPNHYVSRVISQLSGNKEIGWKYTTVNRQRGEYRLGPMYLRTSDPFGLFQMKRSLAQTTPILIYPHTVDLAAFPMTIGELSGDAIKRNRSQQMTTNAVSVRDYVVGDSFNRIHWKTTARRNSLMVKEFEIDPKSDLWVISDVSHPAHYQTMSTYLNGATSSGVYHLPPSTLEYTISVTATIMQYLLQSRPVGLWINDEEMTVLQPDTRDRQQIRMLERLAVVEPHIHTTTLAEQLLLDTVHFRRGDTLVVVTPNPSEEWITIAQEFRLRGYHLVTILVNGESFGGGESTQSLHDQLIANGFIVYQINYGDDLSSVLSTPQIPTLKQKRYAQK